MDPDQKRIKELKTLIKDALYDMQVRRIHAQEFHESCLNLIEELKKLEEEKKTKRKSWPRFMEQFSKITKKELKPKMPKSKGFSSEVV